MKPEFVEEPFVNQPLPVEPFEKVQFISNLNVFFLLMSAALAGLLIFAPQWVNFFAAKEELVEQIGHLFLLFSTALTFYTLITRKILSNASYPSSKPNDLKLLAFLGAVNFLCLMEETDWGWVYSISFFSKYISISTGGSNFHTTIPLYGPLLILCVVLYYISGYFYSKVKFLNQNFSKEFLPTKSQTVSFLLCAVLNNIFFISFMKHESQTQEVFETCVYVVLFQSAYRFSQNYFIYRKNIYAFVIEKLRQMNKPEGD